MVLFYTPQCVYRSAKWNLQQIAVPPLQPWKFSTYRWLTFSFLSGCWISIPATGFWFCIRFKYPMWQFDKYFQQSVHELFCPLLVIVPHIYAELCLFQKLYCLSLHLSFQILLFDKFNFFSKNLSPADVYLVFSFISACPSKQQHLSSFQPDCKKPNSFRWRCCFFSNLIKIENYKMIISIVLLFGAYFCIVV